MRMLGDCKAAATYYAGFDILELPGTLTGQVWSAVREKSMTALTSLH